MPLLPASKCHANENSLHNKAIQSGKLTETAIKWALLIKRKNKMEAVKARILLLHSVKIKMLAATPVSAYITIPRYPHETRATSISPKVFTQNGGLI